MIGLRVVGIDPGPVPGIVVLSYDEGRLRKAEAVQCSASLAAPVLAALLEGRHTATVVQIEAFVPGRNARKAGGASAITRDLVGQLRQVWEAFDSSASGRLGGHWFQRAAGEVKPWATDHRLDAAGLLDTTKGMRHARDAARHALFCAVRDGGVPDPLSRKAAHA